MSTCSSCGASHDVDARFCIRCGAALAAPPVGPVCGHCGKALAEGTKFCTGCGTPVVAATAAPPEEMEEPEDEWLPGALQTLEARLVPGSAVVLMGNPEKRPLQRLEVRAGVTGQFDSADRDRLLQLLDELVVWEGYLHAEVVDEANPVSCVWHVVNGDIYPLTAAHASALLLYHETLVPSWSPEGVVRDTIEAFSLSMGE